MRGDASRRSERSSNEASSVQRKSGFTFFRETRPPSTSDVQASLVATLGKGKEKVLCGSAHPRFGRAYCSTFCYRGTGQNLSFSRSPPVRFNRMIADSPDWMPVTIVVVVAFFVLAVYG